MSKFTKLSKAEMKNVMGGVEEAPKCYKCCDSHGCSECYSYDNTPTCKVGTRTECNCNRGD